MTFMATTATRMVTAAVLAISLCACSKPGSSFIGKWREKENNVVTGTAFVIERNGDGFLFEDAGTNIPMTIHDGVLSGRAGMGEVSLSYVKKTDSLLMTIPIPFAPQLELVRQ